VRHTMLIVEHSDYDAEESRQFRHGFLDGLTFKLSGAARLYRAASAGAQC